MLVWFFSRYLYNSHSTIYDSDRHALSQIPLPSSATVPVSVKDDDWENWCRKQQKSSAECLTSLSEVKARTQYIPPLRSASLITYTEHPLVSLYDHCSRRSSAISEKAAEKQRDCQAHVLKLAEHLKSR